MKGIQALIVAAGLGIVAAILNFLYLFPASQEHEPVYFIAVKQGRTINRGERLKAGTSRRWRFPRIARPVSWAMRCVGMAEQTSSGAEHVDASRTLSDGTLLLKDDLKTPVEGSWNWARTKGRSGFPSTPARPLSLRSCRRATRYRSWFRRRPGRACRRLPGTTTPKRAAGAAAESEGAGSRGGPRLGRRGPGRRDREHRTLHRPFRGEPPQPPRRPSTKPIFRTSSENVMAIRVTLEDNRVDDRAEKLLDRLHETNYRSVGVISTAAKTPDEDLVQQGQRKPPHVVEVDRAAGHHRPRPVQHGLPAKPAGLAAACRGADRPTASCSWRTSG